LKLIVALLLCGEAEKRGAAGRTRLTMIKLFSVKQKQREAAESANGRAPIKKQSAGELRLQKDISELNLAKTTSIFFPNGKDNLLNFEITIRPDEGYYQ
jgi:ubiquitin-conjugating enzyme E2 M